MGGVDWYLCRSLTTLRHQVNQQWPDRPTGSDGTVGDTSHQARPSDHNPNFEGAVRAWDITAPVGHTLAELLIEAQRSDETRDDRLKYVISHRRIASKIEGWKWRPYTGPNPHVKHAHVSVSAFKHLYDDPTPWNLGDDMALPDDFDTLIEYLRKLKQGTDGLTPPSNPYALALSAQHLRDVRDRPPVTEQRVRQIATEVASALVDDLAGTSLEVDRDAIVEQVIAEVVERLQP